MTFPRILAVAAIFTALSGTVSGVNAGTLENLERERALLVEALISGDLSEQERQKKISLARTRLIDLERMVLRDKSLTQKNTPAVRAAFDNRLSSMTDQELWESVGGGAYLDDTIEN